jgi:hypothetical protein
MKLTWPNKIWATQLLIWLGEFHKWYYLTIIWPNFLKFKQIIWEDHNPIMLYSIYHGPLHRLAVGLSYTVGLWITKWGRNRCNTYTSGRNGSCKEAVHIIQNANTRGALNFTEERWRLQVTAMATPTLCSRCRP